VKLFKSFVHEDVYDEEPFSWNDALLNSVRVFNIFNTQFLSKIFSEKRIDAETADKVAIAGWYWLASVYVKGTYWYKDKAEDNSVGAICNKIVDRYFPTPIDDFIFLDVRKFAVALIERGLEQSTEYVKITQSQLTDDENAAPISWTDYLACRSDAF